MKKVIQKSWTEERKKKAREIGKKFRHSEKTKLQISRKHKNKKLSQETKQKLSIIATKQWADNKNRENLSKIIKKKWADKDFHEKMATKIKQRCSKPVVCICSETNEKMIFSSIVEASKKLSIGEGSIRDYLKGRIKTTHKAKYTFVYLSESTFGSGAAVEGTGEFSELPPPEGKSKSNGKAKTRSTVRRARRKK